MSTFKESIVQKKLVFSCDLLKNITLDDLIIQAYFSSYCSLITHAIIFDIDYNDCECDEFEINIDNTRYVNPLIIVKFKTTEVDDMMFNAYIFCRRWEIGSYHVIVKNMPHYDNIIKEYLHNIFSYIIECNLSYKVYRCITYTLFSNMNTIEMCGDSITKIKNQYGSLLHQNKPLINKSVTHMMDFDNVIIFLCSHFIYGVDLGYDVFYQRYIITNTYKELNPNAMLLYGILGDMKNGGKIPKFIKRFERHKEYQEPIDYVFPQEYIQSIVEKIQNMQINFYFIYRIYHVLSMYSGATDESTLDFYNHYMASKNTKNARKC